MEAKPADSAQELTFDDFKRLARDCSLTPHEKIGFPNSYREGKEDAIFQDILRKLPNLRRRNQTVLEIGAGCSGPAFIMIAHCKAQEHKLVLIDSEEMLSHLPDEPFIVKIPGRYPDQCAQAFDRYGRTVNAIICYSVLHYIFHETNLFDFVDRSLTLLADGGEMLIGDIPNVSKRKRFFSSPAGVAFHQAYTGTNEVPAVQFSTVEPGKIDDAVVLGLVARARAAGADAYILPQPAELPMANRREDILICRA